MHFIDYEEFQNSKGPTRYWLLTEEKALFNSSRNGAKLNLQENDNRKKNKELIAISFPINPLYVILVQNYCIFVCFYFLAGFKGPFRD